MEASPPQKQHKWLEQLLGEWTYTFDARMGPDQAPHEESGPMSVRAFGPLWIVGEMSGQHGKSLLTLGYDSRRERFVGTWMGEPMDFLWVYDGKLDGERLLRLDCEGPDMSPESKGGMARYQDVVEIAGPNHWMLHGQIQQPDGSWFRFMTTHYRR